MLFVPLIAALIAAVTRRWRLAAALIVAVPLKLEAEKLAKEQEEQARKALEKAQEDAKLKRRQAARKQLNSLRHRVEVIVETAHPLSNPLRDRIVGRLQELLGSQVILSTAVNEDLLGGLVVRVGDTVYDASLAARLKRMQEVTLDHTKQTIRQSLERFAVST